MAARASVDTCKALVKSYTVKAAGAVTEGYPVKFHTDGTIVNCGAGDAAVGYAMETKAAGEIAQIAHVGSAALVKAKVGTGGVTTTTWVKAAADGVINTGTLGGGTTLVNVVGLAVQTGVAGDFIGVLPIAFAGVSA